MRNMGWCPCSVHPQQGYCIFLGLWSGISGIVALTLNDKSQCDESYQTLMVLGIGLATFSVLYFLNCFSLNHQCFFLLVYISAIFVFVLDCMLLDDMRRGNQSDGCSGGRGKLRLWIVVATVPFLLIVCGAMLEQDDIEYTGENFYGEKRFQSAAFQTLLL